MGMGAGVKRTPDVPHRRALRHDEAGALLFTAGAVPVAVADKEPLP
jgi:hypothetical protein